LSAVRGGMGHETARPRGYQGTPRWTIRASPQPNVTVEVTGPTSCPM
jgi:hypothetical protein